MKNIVYAVFCLMVIASCRPAKKIQKVVTIKDSEARDTTLKPNVPATVVDSVAAKAEIFTRVNSNKIDFNFFSGKIKERMLVPLYLFELKKTVLSGFQLPVCSA